MNASRTLEVLYIDDDEGLVRLAKKELERRGMRVTATMQARNALEILQTRAFDAVALDHFMPGSDGLETLAAIRARDNPPPVLYVTAAEDGRIAVAALKAGAADFVIKDVRDAFFDLLAAAIEQATEQNRLRIEKEAADAAVREARDRAEWLLREVNHRCANSLQLVGSLVSMQANHILDAGAKQALRETVNRINAIGQVHRRLYSTDDVRNVDMQSYLEGLVHELQSVMEAERKDIVIKLDADHIRMPTDSAISLGVIVSELITNAFKYAYPPDAPGGDVRVSLKESDGGAVELIVADDGVGWLEEQSALGSGLGMRIIAAMTDGLKGALSRDAAAGARIAIKLPQPALRRDHGSDDES